jgi:hypothetical protein
LSSLAPGVGFAVRGIGFFRIEKVALRSREGNRAYEAAACGY